MNLELEELEKLEELVILNLNTFKFNFNQLISYINDCTGLLSLLWFVAGFIMIVMVCCRAYYDFKQFFCYWGFSYWRLSRQ